MSLWNTFLGRRLLLLGLFGIANVGGVIYATENSEAEAKDVDTVVVDTASPSLASLKLQRGAVLLNESFNNLDNWHFEGLVQGVSQPQPGVLRLDCSHSRQGGIGCMAFCKQDFPDSILLEYDLYVEEKKGLVITFLGMQGVAGEDAITGVPAREGRFIDYIGENATTRSYHVSVSRRNDKGEHSGVSNWRRNPGLHMMGQGDDLCKKIRSTYHMAIVKRGPWLQLFVNDRMASEFTDPQELPGERPSSGKIGFRVIGDRAIARFSNVKVTELK